MPPSRATAAGTTTKPRVRKPAAPRKPPPKVAPARRSATPPRAPFVLLVVGLLGGALVSLLLLNTVLAQDAFTLSELQRGNQQLSERKQALQEDINRENSPSVLHSKARGLGMVDGQRPAFIDPRTGRVTQSGTRPPGVSDEAMAAAAGAGVTGAPGAIMPPAGGSAPRGRDGRRHAVTARRGRGPATPPPGGPRGTRPRPERTTGGDTRAHGPAGRPRAGRDQATAAPAQAAAPGSRASRAVPRSGREGVMIRRDPVKRLNVALLLVAFVLSLFAGRLVQLQGIESKGYAQAAVAQRLNQDPCPPSAVRSPSRRASRWR